MVTDCKMMSLMGLSAPSTDTFSMLSRTSSPKGVGKRRGEGRRREGRGEGREERGRQGRRRREDRVGEGTVSCRGRGEGLWRAPSHAVRFLCLCSKGMEG